MNTSRLPVPILDDRRFQDLVDESRRLISRRCPEWSSFEAGDPGVMIIEIFAYMIDQLLYRLNQVPDAMYTHFLNMVGISPALGTVAEAALEFWFSDAVSDITIPAGAEISTEGSETTEPVVFTTFEEVRLVQPQLVFATVSGAKFSEDIAPADTVRVTIAVEDESGPADRPAVSFGFQQAVPGVIVRIQIELSDESWAGIGPDPAASAWEWEYSTHDGSFVPAELLSDTTRNFTTSGEILVAVGPKHASCDFEGHRNAWLRARWMAYERYPLSATIAASGSAAGMVVRAKHLHYVGKELVGTGDGRPDQRFAVAHAPIASIGPVERVAVGSETWTEVDSFSESDVYDMHFELDRSRGELRFGDGMNGRIPESGEEIVVSYWHGGGATGNVGSHTLRVLRTTIPYVMRVDNRRAASGGLDPEPIEHVRRRAPGLLRTGWRGVTADDYERLALECDPRVARARSLAPIDENDVVHLLIVPHVSTDPEALRFEEFSPSIDVVKSVASYIDDRRLIGTRVSIEPPKLQGVVVIASLQTRELGDAEVMREARATLSRYLHPVYGGPKELGWPFGRPVIAGELFGVLLSVPGVDFVDDLQLATYDPITGEHGPLTSRIYIDENALIFPGSHVLRSWLTGDE